LLGTGSSLSPCGEAIGYYPGGKCRPMKILSKRTRTALPILGLAILLFTLPMQTRAQSSSAADSRPEEIEWTWEVRPPHPDAKLPNVLLVGDSISRNYYPEVKRQLSEVANVYLFAGSTSVGDPRLERQLAEFATLEAVSFRIVHFNNGMHGWDYTEDEYRQAFPALIGAIRAISPGASLVWASMTPVKVDKVPGPTNQRVIARNAIALAFVSKAGIPVDDQHALMMNHLDTYQDTVHFNDDGARIQGKQAADSIRKLLR
jgi:hypothetical protein